MNDKRVEWKKLVEQQRRSGLSVSEWCRRQGLSESQFHYWRPLVESRKTAVNAGRFVRIDGSEAMEIVVGEKVKLKVPPRFDSDTLKRLLEVLGC